MKIAVDTNVPVRAVVGDDPHQSAVAVKTLRAATVIAVPVPVLCECVWVLRRVYALAAPDIAEAVRALLDTGNVVVNRAAADAGLAMLEAGGDFAAGAIAYEGGGWAARRWFPSTKKAVALLSSQGHPATLL